MVGAGGARRAATGPGSSSSREDSLALGPEAGTPDPARRIAVPVLWRDTRVAELAVDGAIDRMELGMTVAAGIADLCLVGWDTGGEAWVSWNRPSFE